MKGKLSTTVAVTLTLRGQCVHAKHAFWFHKGEEEAHLGVCASPLRNKQG